MRPAVRRPIHRCSRATCVLAFVALAVGVVACGNSPGKSADTSGTSGDASTGGSQVAVTAPGVTDTEIRVGGVASTTNPLGGLEGDSFNGVKAYFDKINDEGGIYGRKLVLAAERDDKLANNKAEVQGLLTQDNVFAVLPVATLLFTGADLLVQEKVPTFGWNINGEWSGTPADPRANLFGQAGSYICFTCASPVLPWLLGQAGRHKVGLLAYAVPAVGRLRRRHDEQLREVRIDDRQQRRLHRQVAGLRHRRPLGAGVQDEGRRGGLRRHLHGHERRDHAGQGDEEAGPRRGPVAPQRLRPPAAVRVRGPLRGLLRPDRLRPVRARGQAPGPAGLPDGHGEAGQGPHRELHRRLAQRQPLRRGPQGRRAELQPARA